MKWLYLIFLPVSVWVSAQEKPTIDAVQDSVFNQLIHFPQEKIHLHTDRTMYTSGEKIWFKAYVADAFSHQSPTFSQYVYVELINAADSLVHRVMVSSDDNGSLQGHIFLSDLVPDGDYTLRAYTRAMENIGDDYFYKKPIQIRNLVTVAKPTGRQPRYDYDVSFFPEGGNLLEGVSNRVAFKALNRQGVSEFITGEIVDQAGNPINEVSTVFAGMGSFTYTPEAGKDFFFKTKNGSGQEKRFKLPQGQKTWAVHVGVLHNNRYMIQVNHSPGLPEKPLFLLVHCRGMVLYFKPWDYRSNFISLSNEQMPSGVVQVLLLDEQMNPVSERLIFNKNNDQATLALSVDKPFYQKRGKVSSEIFVTDAEGYPLAGHVSIAVTDNMDVAIDTLHTITASLLLSSELRGFIESPDYYLQDNRTSALALDHLMMTHGWRRYDIPEALKGNYQHPVTEFEVTKELSGTVKSLILGRPVANAEVLFFSSDENFGITDTDSAGFFRFYLHYPDSVSFFVQALNQKGKPWVELIVNRETFPKPKQAPFRLSLSPADMDTDMLPSDNTFDFITKAGQRAQYDEDIRIINLPEIVITARRIEKKDEARSKIWFNSGSDQTIYREEIEKRNPTRVRDMLFGVAGVSVEANGRVLIRGVRSIEGSNLPLVLIDGMAMIWSDDEESPLDMISIHDVESIDIFKGSSAAIFGARGANGAISITTRRGDFSSASNTLSANIASFFPIGYQKPVEFYSPQYDTPATKYLGNPDYRSTIFWKPDLMVDDNGKASFDFYTSDFPTTYTVVIEGLSYDGKIVRHVETIEVR